MLLNVKPISGSAAGAVPDPAALETMRQLKHDFTSLLLQYEDAKRDDYEQLQREVRALRVVAETQRRQLDAAEPALRAMADALTQRENQIASLEGQLGRLEVNAKQVRG